MVASFCRPRTSPRQAVKCTASAGAAITSADAAIRQGGADKDAVHSSSFMQSWTAWWKLESPEQSGKGDTKSSFAPLAKKMLSLCRPDAKLFVFACIFMVGGSWHLRAPEYDPMTHADPYLLMYAFHPRGLAVHRACSLACSTHRKCMHSLRADAACMRGCAHAALQLVHAVWMLQCTHYPSSDWYMLCVLQVLAALGELAIPHFATKCIFGAADACSRGVGSEAFQSSLNLLCVSRMWQGFCLSGAASSVRCCLRA